MAGITLKLNANDLAKIYEKTAKIQKGLTSKDGAVFKYIFTIGDGYTQAVLSGIGTTVTGVTTLREFLGEPKTVKWKPLAAYTTKKKMVLDWSLEIWKATGDTEEATKESLKITSRSTGIDLFAGIDGIRFSEAFYHAYRAEFGVSAAPGQQRFNGRALFTLLNVVMKEKSDVIQAGIMGAIKAEIAKASWGT